MTNFEKVTKSREAFSDFLSSLSVIEGPWDEEFHKRFCHDCTADNCDAENCPHNAERSNPNWWLNLEAKGGSNNEV